MQTCKQSLFVSSWSYPATPISKTDPGSFPFQVHVTAHIVKDTLALYTWTLSGWEHYVAFLCKTKRPIRFSTKYRGASRSVKIKTSLCSFFWEFCLYANIRQHMILAKCHSSYGFMYQVCRYTHREQQKYEINYN